MARKSEQGLKGTRKGESSWLLCDRPVWAGLAPLVRGSSRRIHDYVGGPSGSIHEYQSDQPSSKASSAFARTALPGIKYEKPNEFC
jgi:hypothetical protein